MRFVSTATLALFATAASAQYPNPTVEQHVAAARAVAGEHAGMVDRLCPMPGTARAGTVPPGGPRPVPARDTWHAEPVKVFDNLYFVGMTEFATWAVTTSAGIVVIDPVFDYSVEDEVVGGLTKLGLDPKDIRYVIVSHGHFDHAGGAKLLQDRFGARVLLSAADWDLLEREKPSWLPRRDIEVVDGQKLTVGDTTFEMYLTPGHTNGTISTLFPVRDGAARHVAALWGGTLFNFGPDAERFTAYAKSSARFRDIAAHAGADIILSNHTDYDGSKQKLPALATRAANSRHPYVVGADSVRRYLTVANECAQAALATLE